MKKRLWVLPLLALVAAGGAKFYHYNYVEHTRGQARLLRLEGFRDFVCKGAAYKAGRIDQCGRRSFFRDADWGVTAYITVYGVETKEEAEEIVRFAVNARAASGQQNIPMHIEIFSSPRSEGSSPSSARLISRRL